MKKFVNEEAGKNNQTQLKTTGRNVEGEKTNLDNQAKNMKTQRSKSALKISFRRNVGVERRRKHDQSLSGGARRKPGTASFW
jgi:hypothetical protein